MKLDVNVRRYLQKIRYIKSQKYLNGNEDILEIYRKYTFRKLIFIVSCLTILLVVSIAYLSHGSYPLTFSETYHTVWNHIIGNVQDEVADHIVFQIRMPTIIEGLISGAALAVTGCVMQSVLKNPLADSYTTGISSGASLGAALAIIYGLTVITDSYGIVINAFVLSLIPSAMIIAVSKMKGASPTTMILAGLAVMYIFNSITTLIMLKADPEDLAAVYQWEVGTISNAMWDNIPVMLTMTITGTAVLMYLSSHINVMSSGDVSAKSLGIDVSKLRIFCMIIISLMTASIVSFTGVIGFVGLVCPHISRMMIGSDNRYLIPASALFGASFLLMADYIGTLLFAPSSLQVGVVTAFVGGPLFLILILTQKKEEPI